MVCIVVAYILPYVLLYMRGEQCQKKSCTRRRRRRVLVGDGGLISRQCVWWRRLSLEYVNTAVNIDEVRTT